MFIIQLTPTYRLRIDTLNITLMKKRTKKNAIDFIEDDESEDDYGALGYYSKNNLHFLLTVLVNDRILAKASKPLLSLTAFDKLVEDTSSDLLKRMQPVMVADASLSIIDQKNKDIGMYRNEIKCLKRKLRILEKN